MTDKIPQFKKPKLTTVAEEEEKSGKEYYEGLDENGKILFTIRKRIDEQNKLLAQQNKISSESNLILTSVLEHQHYIRSRIEVHLDRIDRRLKKIHPLSEDTDEEECLSATIITNESRLASPELVKSKKEKEKERK